MRILIVFHDNDFINSLYSFAMLLWWNYDSRRPWTKKQIVSLFEKVGQGIQMLCQNQETDNPYYLQLETKNIYFNQEIDKYLEQDPIRGFFAEILINTEDLTLEKGVTCL